MNATSINENDKITQYTCHFFIANGLSKLKKKKKQIPYHSLIFMILTGLLQWQRFPN